ncbi:hypothetical protein [Pseudomonas sp. B21-047]|uniref:hypothetical protein n=1 Tax=Pseudomonas sp. B21-047 TaxID=2895489 RepID=UPI00216035D6|nr:hypothetical protein [Pseudomonas sp. B21-047]UVL05981.1 hypothetical protein LOY26_10755 [Pseudomonas sp. B21-047]
MAIIENDLRRLRHYPFRALDEKVANTLLKAASDLTFTGDDPALTVYMLECYCDLAGLRVTQAMLTTSCLATIHNGFCGALLSGQLIKLSSFRTRRFCRYFASILQKIKIQFPSMQRKKWQPEPFAAHIEIWTNSKNQISEEKAAYWQGWPIEDKKCSIHWMHLANLYNTHGKKFVDELYRGVRVYSESRATTFDRGYERLVAHLVSNPLLWPPSTFKSPTGIYNFFADLLKHTFKGKSIKSRSTIDLGHRWDRHISEVYRSFINPRIWASPIRTLPVTKLKPSRGGETHIKVTKAGKEVRTKLITPLPLQVTQTEAIHILAVQISKDINILREWATTKATSVIMASLERAKLAKSATNSDIADREFWESNTLANIAALFEATPYDLPWNTIASKYRITNNIRNSSRTISKALGIPATRDLYPFQCLLILEHPNITDSFLKNFNLYDKNGNIKGIRREGGKTYLVSKSGIEATIISGYKPRRGVTLTRQEFELSPAAIKIIDDVIRITQQARDYLRKIGDDNWRKLFIASSSGIIKPTTSSTPRWNKAQTLRKKDDPPEFVHEFAKILGATDINEALEFVAQISPSSIRASRAVEIYLQTGKTEIMRECLGHDKTDKKLLESYLPEIFIMLIESRSVMVIQKIIICTALKDSPFLAEAAGFDNLSDLEEFTKNYLHEELPAYLKDPDRVDEALKSEELDKIVFSIGVKSLSTLLSLRDATRLTIGQAIISPVYLHWASITNLLSEYIENGFQRELKRKMAEAKKLVDPTPFVRKILGQ